jgi:hypothetical protein
MKKSFIIVVALFLCLTACNRTPERTSSALPDPGAGIGPTRHIDSISPASSSANSKSSADSIDTIYRGKIPAFPATDTANKKNP